ncbi:hypothetical protein C8J57DRAFT_1729833 [Mycena rebaudengoi]|nr:hypothetical protein C8J57DRAFT_1729833 [Mycena rebaudengoi]
MLSTETTLECFYSAHDTTRYTIRVMYVYFLAVSPHLVPFLPPFEYWPHPLYIFPPLHPPSVTKPRHPSAFRLFLYTPLRHPVNTLRFSMVLLPPHPSRPFLSLPQSSLAPIHDPPTALRLRSSTVKLTSACRLHALAQVLLTDNVVASSAMLRPPADERDGGEHRKGDTISTGPTWVDLSLFLHPSHPHISNLAPCPSTTDDDSVRTTSLAYPRDVPTPLPAADDTVFAATTTTPALPRGFLDGDGDGGSTTRRRDVRALDLRAVRVVPARECVAQRDLRRWDWIMSLDREANAPGDEGEAGERGNGAVITLTLFRLRLKHAHLPQLTS